MPMASASACRTESRPDIVLPKYGVAIMVNGCFWHGHKGCRYATKPKSNVDFWETKIARNRHRDEVTEAHLTALGWHVVTIWECELRNTESASARISALADEIRKAGEFKQHTAHQAKERRRALKQIQKELLQRQSQLEAEIASLYPIPKRIKKASMEDI